MEGKQSLKALEDFDDSDFSSLLKWMFWEFPRLLRTKGVFFVGISLKEREDDFLLVVRKREKGILLVGFVSSVDPIRCMAIFRRKFLAETITWVRDKFVEI